MLLLSLPFSLLVLSVVLHLHGLHLHVLHSWAHLHCEETLPQLKHRKHWADSWPNLPQMVQDVVKLLAGDFGLGWVVEVDGNDSGWLEEHVVVTGLLK